MDLVELVRLKALDRAGWVKRGVSAPESVAAHSWGVAWLVLVLLPGDLNRGKALAYAVIHDLAEVRVGDLVPQDGVAHDEKHRREAAAMADICSDRPDLLALWAAYEAQVDAESRFVRELDRLDMALQAVAYHLAGSPGMAEFIESAAAMIRHPALLPILNKVRAQLT